MATKAAYTLLEMQERSGTYEGPALQVGGRTAWTARLRVARIDAGGSVTVQIETSPDGADESFEVAGTAWAAQTAAGAPDDKTITLTDRDKYVRASVTAASGNYTIEVRAWSAFLNPSDNTDKALLSQELRGWADGLTRTVEEAEQVILQELMRAPSVGALSIDLNANGAYDAMRTAIATQADWMFAGKQLGGSRKPADAAALLRRPRLAPGVLNPLLLYRPGSARAWRGR